MITLRLYKILKQIIYKINILNKNKIEIVKLWENASPTSAFAAQTLSIDLTNYDEVIIESLSGVSANASKYLTSVICPKGKITTALAQAYTMRLRDFTVNMTNIVIGVGRDLGTNWSAVTDNSSAIPFRIYGIKGVL